PGCEFRDAECHEDMQPETIEREFRFSDSFPKFLRQRHAAFDSRSRKQENKFLTTPAREVNPLPATDKKGPLKPVA
ncbi:MAG: hypothetical protein OQK23_01010, partial [Rhodospirillales bacterium]|nr:hypothetical protein [Rhodospirillales bacterium]